MPFLHELHYRYRTKPLTTKPMNRPNAHRIFNLTLILAFTVICVGWMTELGFMTWLRVVLSFGLFCLCVKDYLLAVKASETK